jgi:hypothetical protein
MRLRQGRTSAMPGTLAMFGLGMAALSLIRRRQRSA